MIRNLVILWLSLSLVSAILGVVSIFSQGNEAGASNIRALTGEIEKIEKQLDFSEEKKGPQTEIRNDLETLKADLARVGDRYLEERRFDWWTEGLQPVIFLIFLVYCLKNKNFLADPRR